MFEAAGGFEVAGEVEDGAQAVDACRLWSPDIILMDVEMPHMNGFEATRRITQACPGTSVVIASMRPQPEYHAAAAEAGALMFMSKRDLDPVAIRAALDGRGTAALSRAA